MAVSGGAAALTSPSSQSFGAGGSGGARRESMGGAAMHREPGTANYVLVVIAEKNYGALCRAPHRLFSY